MEKLLRILFVISVIAFVTTATACADDDKTGGNDKTAINPGFFLFTPEAKGVTIDKSKDVYKITINPSLLTYDHTFPSDTTFQTFHPAPIFTVTFTNDKKGFIIPTTAAKADALTTTHKANLEAARTADKDEGAVNNVTHSFLAAVKPGFSATELNADWSTLAPRKAVFPGGGKPDIPVFKGVTDIMPDTKVRVSCTTIITGINKDSFLAEAPDAANDLAIAKGTETKCAFSLIGHSINPADQKAAYIKWAEAAVKLAKDDSTKNIQKMGFVGIVTGDDKASEITKAAGSLLNADITAATSAKLVKAYNSVLQKVEIVIAVAK